MTASGERRIQLGRIVAASGLQGQFKLESWTEPREAIFTYRPWTLERPGSPDRLVERASGRAQGRGLVGRIDGMDTREQAEALVGSVVSVPRSQLPPPAPGEYYWVDLEGLEVLNREGVSLGRVSHLFSTPANDVVVVKGEREHLVPFLIGQFVDSIDIDAGRMVVDWDPDF